MRAGLGRCMHTPWPFLATRLIRSIRPIPTPVRRADHNISSPLGKQLVLELERGVSLAETINRLPCGFRGRHVRPLDEDVPNSAA